jgi:hypothetical protein
MLFGYAAFKAPASCHRRDNAFMTLGSCCFARRSGQAAGGLVGEKL